MMIYVRSLLCKLGWHSWRRQLSRIEHGYPAYCCRYCEATKGQYEAA